jgi:hypothetical protein
MVSERVKLAFGIPASLLALIGLVGLLAGAAGLETKHAHARDVERLELRMNDMNVAHDHLQYELKMLSGKMERTLCLVEAQSGIRPYSDCVR